MSRERERRVAVFGYGSLVSRASCEATLGEALPGLWPAELAGWRRGFTQARRNRLCEKTFARPGDGEIPEWVLGLNVEPARAGSWVNGALIELSAAGRERLDRRELRYRRRDVSAAFRSTGEHAPSFDLVYTYVARPEHHAPSPPAGAVILRSYAAAVEAAFADLGPGELQRYRASTDVPEVEIIDGVLIHDAIPPGNPRDW